MNKENSQNTKEAAVMNTTCKAIKALGITLGVLGSAMIAQSAIAQPGDGNVQGFTCPIAVGSEATFRELPSSEKKFGFGNSAWAIDLVNATESTRQCGAQFINLPITPDTSAKNRRFFNIVVFFKDDGTARNNATTVVCFRNQSNQEVTRIKPLKDYHLRRVPNSAWTTGNADSREFGGGDISNSNVVKLSIYTDGAGPSNMTLGQVTILEQTPGQVSPQDRLSDNAGCEGKGGCVTEE